MYLNSALFQGVLGDMIIIMMGLTLKKPRPKQTGRLNQSLSAFAGSARQPGKLFLHINPESGWEALAYL